MKKLLIILGITMLGTICIRQSAQAQTNTFPSTGSAGIGTLAPAASSALEIKSTTQGLLIPRMTKAQRDLIGSPVTGLMIYQTDNTPGFYYYDSRAWTAVSKKAANTSLSNLMATSINQSLLPKANDSLDLGSATAAWRNIYTAGYIYFGSTRFMHNTGSSCTFVGNNSGNLTLTGAYNTIIGASSGIALSSGTENAFLGDYTGTSNSSGSGNTFAGSSAGQFNTIGKNNTFTGAYAGKLNQTGYSNVAIGIKALFNNQAGSHLVAIGDSALYSQSGGTGDNVAIGSKSLFANTTGADNTASGFLALYKNTSGNSNTANGDEVLYNNTSGVSNTANGAVALYVNTNGSFNTATGYLALSKNTIGSNSTACGAGALLNNVDGSYNVALGQEADVSAGNLSNAVAIGFQAVANASNKVVIGRNLAGVVIGGYAAWSNLSDGRFKENIKENVPGLQFITRLRPVTYTINTKKLEDHIMQNMPDSIKAIRKQKPEEYTKAARKIQTGFVAQEVEKTAKDLGYDFDGVNAPQNATDNYSIAYSQFVVPLVKAVQELSAANDAKDAKIEALENQMKAVLQKLDAVQTAQQACCNNAVLNASGVVIAGTAALEQNIPNPFKQTTSIGYTLPQQFSNAQIVITAKSGQIVKTANVSGAGKGRLSVDASVLASGAYNYSLYVDGKLVGTKQMILAK